MLGKKSNNLRLNVEFSCQGIFMNFFPLNLFLKDEIYLELTCDSYLENFKKHLLSLNYKMIFLDIF